MRDRTRQPALFEPAPASLVADAFDSARLTQARVLAGLTKHDLSQYLGVSAAAIGQYEAGVTTPRPDHLQRLADVLGFPVAFFAAGRPHARLDASMAHFRSLRSTRVAHRAKAVALTEQLWELTFALEKRVEFPFVDLPDLTSAREHEPAEPESAAREIRRHWGIGTGPVRHLIRTMELHGIVVSILDVAGEDVARVDAFSTSRLPRPLVILTTDRANDVYRHRFTAAHELGHLLLHTDIAPGDLEQEREADRFAAELLTPAAEIGPELLSRPKIPAMQAIARRWGVSPDSLVRRCKELGIVTDVSARRAHQKLAQLRAAELLPATPVSGYPGETPTLLASAFDLAEQHGLALADLARELAWPLHRVRDLLGHTETRPVLRLVQER